MKNKNETLYKGLSKLKDFVPEDEQLFVWIYRTFDYVDKNENSLLHILANIDVYVDDYVLKNSFATVLSKTSLINQTNFKRNTFLHELLMNKKISYNVKEYVIKMLVLSFEKNGKFLVTVVNQNKENILQLLIKYSNNAEEFNNLLNYLEILNLDFERFVKDENELKKYISSNSTCSITEQDDIYKTILNKREIYLIRKAKLLSALNDFIESEDESEILEEKETKQDWAVSKSSSDIKTLGTILTDNRFLYAPAVGRDNDIEKIIISLASEKKLPLLVGPSGCGKTSLVEQLAFLIQNDMVPNFLKGTIIFETSTSRIMAGTYYRGTMESNMMMLLNYLKNKKAILFIDEIHTIFGAGANETNKANDISSILKEFIDREKIKVIGTTTDKEYQEFIANSPLKRRFDLINIKEPDEIVLFEIIDNYILNRSEDSGIGINNILPTKDNIINIIIKLTNKEHRFYNDILNNPDLAISIIDNSFAYAKCDDSLELKIEHIISAINNYDRIYGWARNTAINSLKGLINYRQIKKKEKIIDFKDYI